MKPTSDVIACVYDHGMVATAMAERLARTMKKVYVFSEWEEGQSTINKAIMGDGFETFERAEDIWQIKNEVDLWVFPDIQRSGLQLELEEQGFAVWGSRAADRYEWDRELFLKTLDLTGLQVPEHEIITGLTNLRLYLEDKEDHYIKVSKYRGTFETSHWRNWKLDEGMLDAWAVKLGPTKERFRFIVFPAIETTLEIGGDTYGVDGKWPGLMLHGIEWKDKSYFGSVTKTTDMPQQIQEILEAFGPVLGKDRFRNQWSMEDRVKSDTEHFFIDATTRFGLPSTGSQLEAWDNWPDIVWAGANGELVEPEPTCKYTAEAMIKLSGDPSEWRESEIPKELQQWMKLADCCEIDGKIVFPADENPHGGEEIGWLIGIGDTPEEAIEAITQHADDLPDGMDANTECLAYVLKEIHEEEKKGIEFGKDKIPEPAIVME